MTFRKKRYQILYTSSFSHMIGGGQWSLYYLIKHLNKKMFRPIVLCPEEGELAEKMRGVGAEVICFDVGRIRYLSLLIIKKFISIIRNKHVDLIHTDSTTETFYAGIAARLMRIPLVWHIRVSEREWLLDRILSLFTTKLIVVAWAISRRFPWLENNHKIVVIHNGIDLKEFDKFQPTSSIRREFNISDNTVLLGCISRIEERKGLEYLLRAMKHIDEAKLILVGGGKEDYITRLKNISVSLGISDRIFFIGRRDDIPAVFRAIDIFVFPVIKGEGFSRVILEAMAAGKPVVATDHAGNPEAVEDGLTGAIVPAKNSTMLATEVMQLVKDSKKRVEMGRAGRKRVEKYFTIKKNIELIENIYIEHIKSK
jgi:glycosyltransferase involved in cell wall biosynthesis